jgi:hypothetical protein
MVEIVGLGGASDPNALALATRKGTPIPNSRPMPKLPAMMRAAVELHRASLPAIRLRSASSEYNCMGQAFASRRTAIDIDEILWVLAEDGFVRISQDKAQPGDLVLYRDDRGAPVHVGVLWKQEPDLVNATWRAQVLSQWGSDGEYFHELNEVPPMLGHATDFWSDRQPL